MEVVRAVSGCLIRLTPSRWEHIALGHPEMGTLRQGVLDTVAEPDLVQMGDYGELLAVRLWPKTPLTTKHIVVVYRESTAADGFVVTAYLARRPSARRSVLWKR